MRQCTCSFVFRVDLDDSTLPFVHVHVSQSFWLHACATTRSQQSHDRVSLFAQHLLICIERKPWRGVYSRVAHGVKWG